MVKVVFLGGPQDGMEMDIPANVQEFRIARHNPAPVAPLVPTTPLQQTYVAYRRTRRVLPDGRIVYAFAR